jgi:transposase
MDTAVSLAFWTSTLNLTDFRVVHLRQDMPDAFRFTLLPVRDIAPCPHCGHASQTVHRRRHSEPIKDLPVGDKAVELVLSIPQYECQRCRRYFTPTYQGIADGAHATERFLAHVARLINFSDIANVAALYGLPERTLARWYYDYLDRQQQQPPDRPLKPIRRIGIDELSLKKSTDSSSP